MIATGIGYDCHQLAEGRRMVLGGVQLPSAVGPVGHSDADVLTHAIIDALLGAAALGDIGQHFPDTDPRFAGADSMVLLRTVCVALEQGGFVIQHVDATVVTEAPKVGPHREEIRASLARSLDVTPAQVNVKATRGEGMGFIGRGEGIAALAVATLQRGARVG